MNTYRYAVTLTLQAPVLSQAAGGRTLGIDAAALRHDGRPALPGSLIRGNLRHAWEYFDREFPGSGAPSLKKDRGPLEIEKLLGKKSDEVTNEPERGRLQFAAYWLARGASGFGQRYRIAIDPETGTVKRRHLQTIETTFASGAEVVYEGYIEVLGHNQADADRIARWVRKGLEFTPALGAFKGVGFGRILAVALRPDPRKAPPIGETTPLPPRFGMRIKLDRPFCFAKPHPSDTNRYESDDFIPGGAILGALARQIFPEGREAAYSTDHWRPLRERFHQIRVTHALPAERGGKRPIALPLSLVFDPEAKEPRLYDVALKRGPLLINGHAPIFPIDWKAKHWEEAYRVYGRPKDPERVVIVRTAIDRKTGAALEKNLFAVAAVRPERLEWLAEADLAWVTADDRGAVAARLRELLSQGLPMLGKTKAVAEVEVMPTPLTAAFESSPMLRPLRLKTGEEAKIAVVALQSAARLLPLLRDIPATNGDLALAAAYGKAWWKLSLEHMELLWYYAQERLVGGNYLWRRFGVKQDPYNPEVLTMPGSVFVLKLTGDQRKAEEQLSDWLAHGLPQLPNAPGGGDWRRTPYIRNNGYGEVAINLDLHWAREPGADVCEELYDD